MASLGIIPSDTFPNGFNINPSGGQFQSISSKIHLFESWSIEQTFQAPQGGLWGFGISGILPSGNRDVGLYIDFNNNLVSISAYLKNGAKFYDLKVTSFILDITHTYSYTLRASRRYVSVFFKDETTGKYCSMKTAILPTANIWGVGQFAVMLPGAQGNTQLNNIKSSIYIEDQINSDAVFVGDSITFGYKVPLLNNTYPMNYFKAKNLTTGIVWGSGGLNHFNAQATINSLCLLQPKKVFIMLGENEDYNSGSVWLPIREQITNQLIASGSNVIQLRCTPRTDTDNSQLVVDLLSEYSGAIDDRTIMLASSSLVLGDPINYNDAVHPNGLGHFKISSTLTSF